MRYTLKDKRLGWIAGGAGVLLLGAAIYFVSGIMEGDSVRPVYNYEWAKCEATEQCAVVSAPCGEWEAVNARFEKEATAYFAHLAEVVEKQGMVCLSTSLRTQVRGAYCQSGACKLAE